MCWTFFLAAQFWQLRIKILEFPFISEGIEPFERKPLLKLKGVFDHQHYSLRHKCPPPPCLEIVFLITTRSASLKLFQVVVLVYSKTSFVWLWPDLSRPAVTWKRHYLRQRHHRLTSLFVLFVKIIVSQHGSQKRSRPCFVVKLFHSVFRSCSLIIWILFVKHNSLAACSSAAGLEVGFIN